MNTYDDKHFFEEYCRLREGENYNDTLETPAMLSLLDSVDGLRILDIGCGFGKTSALLSDMGAQYVLGTDISERMVAKAEREYGRRNVEYRVLPAEDISEIGKEFDLVWSSLCFHYVNDLEQLLRDIHSILRGKGTLIFSVEHPLSTASYDGYYTNGPEGWTGYHLSDYGMEGERRSTWFDTEIVTYHRMMSTILNMLVRSGFDVEHVLEPLPDDAAIKRLPRMIREYQKPSFVVFKAVKR